MDVRMITAAFHDENRQSLNGVRTRTVNFSAAISELVRNETSDKLKSSSETMIGLKLCIRIYVLIIVCWTGDNLSTQTVPWTLQTHRVERCTKDEANYGHMPLLIRTVHGLEGGMKCDLRQYVPFPVSAKD